MAGDFILKAQKDDRFSNGYCIATNSHIMYCKGLSVYDMSIPKEGMTPSDRAFNRRLNLPVLHWFRAPTINERFHETGKNPYLMNFFRGVLLDRIPFLWSGFGDVKSDYIIRETLLPRSLKMYYMTTLYETPRRTPYPIGYKISEKMAGDELDTATIIVPSKYVSDETFVTDTPLSKHSIEIMGGVKDDDETLGLFMYELGCLGRKGVIKKWKK